MLRPLHEPGLIANPSAFDVVAQRVGTDDTKAGKQREVVAEDLAAELRVRWAAEQVGNADPDRLALHRVDVDHDIGRKRGFVPGYLGKRLSGGDRRRETRGWRGHREGRAPSLSRPTKQRRGVRMGGVISRSAP